MIPTEEILREQREWESKQEPALLADLIRQYMRNLIEIKHGNQSTESKNQKL